MIQPGLERIGLLLKDVHFPWKAIHVAGTNGKGSICHYAHAILSRRLIRCGRFTSPHLIDRWDCIHIGNEPVRESAFKKVESHFLALNERENIQASEFEILTATAFQLFNDHKVEIGVVEVGMGGRLDATNILNNQIVSVISKIAYDHQGFLGHTLEEIARHKAGILRPNVPYIVSPGNEWNVKQVIDEVATEVGAGPRRSEKTLDLRTFLFQSQAWHKAVGHLPPPLQDNAGLAMLAVREVLGGEDVHPKKLEKLAKAIKKQFPGRLDTLKVPAVFGPYGPKVLVDGAHNEDAAKVLDHVVTHTIRKKVRETHDGRIGSPQDCWPITWVIAMSEGKSPLNVLRRLLLSDDRVVVTTFGPVDGMPWVKPMDPHKILEAVKSVQPDIVAMVMPEPGALRALCAAKYLTPRHEKIVVTGSLYLVGDFYREVRSWEEVKSFTNMALIDKQERTRVNTFLTQELDGSGSGTPILDSADQDAIIVEERERRKLEQEIQALNEQLRKLDEESAQLNVNYSTGIASAETNSLNEQLQGFDEAKQEEAQQHEMAHPQEQSVKLRKQLKWYATEDGQRVQSPTFRILKHLSSGDSSAHSPNQHFQPSRASVVRVEGTESE
ncbi:FolC bifunctional protein [Lophiostoma macrostomum CBS 122681]|uniref:FolC bifunctional protein n=1 Tax=Lophiostoma macrostomum CBS 122681 TaxID=1314788 RepID=A0A6A6TUC4_9PLEO|nr:FolC bifunctional protein [Lophiostoma macrostomum CBS 122681]